MALHISQFYVLSPRGDTIITRDFRNDVVKGTAEMFFRQATLWEGGDTPPIFHSANINYLFVKKNGLFFVCTTQTNSNPIFVIELLNKITKVFKVSILRLLFLSLYIVPQYHCPRVEFSLHTDLS